MLKFSLLSVESSIEVFVGLIDGQILIEEGIVEFSVLRVGFEDLREHRIKAIAEPQ